MELYAFDDALGLPGRTVQLARLDNLVRLGLAFHPTEQLGKIRSNTSPISHRSRLVHGRGRSARTSRATSGPRRWLPLNRTTVGNILDVELHSALHYNARREHPADLRRQLADVAEAEASTAKQRRRLERRRSALERRLADAEELAGYDWEAAEADFAEWVSGAIRVPGVYERWRRSGIPARVLLRAGYRP